MRTTEREDRGVVLPLTALTIVVLLIAVALTVDIGRASARVRKLQSVADAVALDLAREIDGRTKNQISTDPAFVALITRSSNANDFAMPTASYDGNVLTATDGARTLTVELGVMGPDTVVEKDFQSISGTEVPDAVAVTTGDTTEFYFRPGEAVSERTGVGIRLPITAFRLGSVAAGLDPENPAGARQQRIADLLNRLLTRHVGASPVPGSTDFAIDAASYQGLASTTVTAGDLATAMGFASADQFLSSSVSYDTLLTATATVLTQNGEAGAAATVNGTNRDASRTVRPIDQTISRRGVELNVNNDAELAELEFNVLDLMVGGASVIDGDNFVSFEVTDLLGITGISNAVLDVAFIEPARTGIGPVGTTASTGQGRARLTVTIPGVDVTGLPGPLGVLAGPQDITIPFVFEFAVADTTVTRTDCREPFDDSEVDQFVETGAANFFIAEVSDGDLVSAQRNLPASARTGVPLFAVSVGTDFQSSVTLGQSSETLTFDGPFDESNRQRASGGYNFDSTSPDTLVESLVIGIQPSLGVPASPPITIPGTGVGLIDNLPRRIIQRVPDLQFIDDRLIEPLSDILGLSFGGADVTEFDLECEAPALAD